METTKLATLLRLNSVPAAILLFWISAAAQPQVIFTNLASLNPNTGFGAIGALLEVPDGSFYGVTQSGGAYDKGTIFRMTADGSLTNVASIQEGEWAGAGLVRGPDGNFYGTTENGGATNQGTIFRLSAQGELTTLLSFVGTNGACPVAELVLGKDGQLYGTTRDGGLVDKDCGTIFCVGRDGNFQTLAFLDASIGHPEAPLLLMPDGNFYGTTIWPYPSFFRVTPAGELTRLLRFDGTNGVGSLFGLVAGQDGNLYGTSYGGTVRDPSGYCFGNVFRLTLAGEATNLCNFYGTNGSLPYGLVLAADGNFYGISGAGGIGFNGSALSGNGTVFQVTPAGKISTLMLFTNGFPPRGALIQGSDGCLYGTTVTGGDFGFGGVFRLTVRMAPVFRAIESLHNQMTLSWSAVSGLQYQVEYFGGSTTGVWTALGSPITATNGLVSFSDDSPTDDQRSYRVRLLP